MNRRFQHCRGATACLIVGLLVAANGCCYRNCSGWNGFGNSRVAPPGTFSYQAASAQPYYNGGAGTATNPGTAQPNGIPANPAAGPTQWRPADDRSNGSSFYGPTQPAGQTPTSYQVNSFDRSGYVDQRSDPTQLLASDATGVRAPANFNQYNHFQQMSPNSIVVPGSLQIPGRVNMPAANVAVNSGSVAYPSFGQTSVATRGPSASVASPGNDPNYRAGWRDSSGRSQTMVR